MKARIVLKDRGRRAGNHALAFGRRAALGERGGERGGDRRFFGHHQDPEARRLGSWRARAPAGGCHQADHQRLPALQPPLQRREAHGADGGMA